MKLLFDENISFRIINIESSFPGLEQVKRLGLLSKEDLMIWEYARQHHFTIVTFDEDYYELSLRRGYPPKIVWLRTGNTPTAFLAERLLKKAEVIREFIQDNAYACLELY